MENIIIILACFIIGICLAGKANKISNKYNRFKSVFSILASVLIILLIMQHRNLEQKSIQNNINFSLIYDKEYYWEHNKDVSEKFDRNDETDILNYFISNGMDEGSVASKNFDVSYYRLHNEDLSMLYGDSMKLYYLHYILYGYKEGRKGTDPYKREHENNVVTVPQYSIPLNCYIDAEGKIALDFKCNDNKLLGVPYVLYELETYQYDLKKATLVQIGKLQEFNELHVSLNDVNHKFVLVNKQTKQQLSDFSYISNPELLCKFDGAFPVAKSKKGLQIMDDIDSVEELDPAYTFMNLIVEDIMSPSNESEKDLFVYRYKGKDYYFYKDSIDYYDNLISRLTRDGINVCASIISVYKAEWEFIYYPGVTAETKATFFALNTTDELSVNYIEAFVMFMSERYSGKSNQYGAITKWMVGNEVNDSGVYNYMGQKILSEYVEEYVRTFRIIYNLIKTNNKNANVYVVMEPWLGIDDNGMVYGGKNFLDAFNAKIAQQGNIDWGLAYHAYSYPMCDPKVLNDDEAALSDDGINMTEKSHFTKDTIDTATITMKNISVLTEYLHNDSYLTSSGKVRSIILSEQGYTSNSNLYGKCEAQQAASMVYAYYKAQMNEDIDAFIYFLQMDDNAASLGNSYYQFGLCKQENGNFYKKLSYDVFRVMDTKESLQELDFIKDILDVTNWDEIMPEFNDKVFEMSVKGDSNYSINLGKKDISKGLIATIAEQNYTGKECLPDILIEYNGEKLQNDKDYDVVYLNNIEEGEAQVIVVGLNKYYGILKTSFVIK